MTISRSAVVLVGLALFPSPGAWAQMATFDRVREPGWWPTKAASRRDFVGSKRCTGCHPRQAGQVTTPMGTTAFRAPDADILRTHERLAFAHGSYTYAIEAQGARRVYSVSDGRRSLSEVLEWAFGAGTVGQTYLFERDGRFHEARVSYYEAIDGLGFTPERELSSPRDVEEAIGRPIDDQEAVRCFACHTTGSTTEAGLEIDALEPGITCEACHGPGRRHAEKMEPAGWAPVADTIMNPEALPPVDAVDFCGACHSTFWDVKLANQKGIAALRSQPYRLQSSRCWGEGDARITCTACHDPHQRLVRGTRKYDARCLDCHVVAGAEPTPTHPGRACRVASEDCAGCHMPRYEVEEMHSEFTDHLIRVAPAPSRPPAPSGPGGSD